MPTADSARARFGDDPRFHGLEPLGFGANRLCVRDPGDPAYCLKYELDQGAGIAMGRREHLRRWLGRRFARFGDNAVELRAWRRLHARLDGKLAGRFAACHGIVDTPAGRALRCECVLDGAGHPAPSLYALLFERPRHDADALCAAVDDLEAWLLRHRVPLFDLNVGNLVVVEEAAGPRLVCVDAKSTLVAKQWLPLARWIPALARRKVARRAARLRRRIRVALAAGLAEAPGSH